MKNKIIRPFFEPMGFIKIVQLYIKDEPKMAIGPTHLFHGEILDEILKEENINFEKIKLGEKIYHAKLNGDSYFVTGMSNGLLMPNEIILDHNRSLHYGIGLDINHAEKIKLLLEKENYKITIFK